MEASLYESESNLLYLVEMFPSVEVDSIIAIIAHHPRSSIEALVEQCLALDAAVFLQPSAPPLPASAGAALSDPGESAAQEAVSLVPASWAPHAAAATFSRASSSCSSSSFSSSSEHACMADAEPGAESPRTVALPAANEAVANAAAAIVRNLDTSAAKATIGMLSAARFCVMLLLPCFHFWRFILTCIIGHFDVTTQRQSSEW
jgi:hypothetical protein